MQSPATTEATAAGRRLHHRASEILADFSTSSVTAPWLMCDRHSEEQVAFRFVLEDLSELTMTYGDLKARSERAAHVLAAQGVRVGDRVASLMGKGPDLPALILGIWRLGAVYVPLFTAFAASTVADRVAAAAVRVIVTDPAQAQKVAGLGCTVMLANLTEENRADPHLSGFAPFVDGDMRFSGSAAVEGPEAALVHMFTSGTTGKPKAVVHPLSYVASWQSYLELGIAPGATFWCGADPGWAYGLYTSIVAPMTAGIPSIISCGTFKAETSWQVLETFGVTDFAAAPTVFRAMRSADPQVDLPRLCGLSSAGEPLTPDVGEWTRARLGVDVHDHFGQTELGMPAGFAHHSDLLRVPVPGAMGTAFPGWELAALKLDSDDVAEAGEVGRLAVRVDASPFFTFTGYGVDRDVRGSRFTDDGSHYLTGDLVSINDEGLIRFSSRDDDVILMAGYRIGPFDVESVLVTHPAVAEAAVVAAPDEIRGEVIHAFVVPTDPTVLTDPAAGQAMETALQGWVKQNYGAHAYPRRITFTDSLPKTPSGKVQRAVLRKGLETTQENHK
ncbi:AMP-dependent synthetase [Pseudarthrobacter sp. AG30]|uniref:AMP-binding protein n=1 Tax=Pseudarthrobacter sp. AG30 TaxID=2249742 RepID=UPI000D6DD42D|nr:AMP-binding protein [Pseudarthrobacter sp. AG30]RAX14755.1 AMP-dependent synthetase [Pseudarthrobacter sp. AG30]